MISMRFILKMDNALLEAARHTPRDLPGLHRAARLVRISRGVRFDGHCFRIDGKVVSGLLGRLQRVTGWSSANPRARTYAETKRRRSSIRRVTRSCPTWGEPHGTRVHAELARACRAVANLRTLSNKVRKRDPCTERVLKFLLAKRWIPVAPEQPVGARGLATAVDLIAVDARSGELIAIEFKTGYESEEYGPTQGDARLPLGFRDCPRDRHELQLASTCLLMPEQPDRAYIVRPCSKARGIEWREVRWWKEPLKRSAILKMLYGN